MSDVLPTPSSVVRLGDGHVRLMALRGVDEQAVVGTDAHQACDLLDRLLADAPGTCAGPGDAARLTVAERDRLLASVYRDSFGDHVAATATCAGCAEQFDLGFALTALVDKVQFAPLKREVRLEDGTQLRVPTGEDEQAVASLPLASAAQVLLRRCIVEPGEGRGDVDLAAAARALEEAAPVLDLEADARCPECGGDNSVHVSVQDLLLGALFRERSGLLGEVHMLARAYGWGLADILGLPRVDRRAFVALLEREGLGGAA
ncbi:MAG: hypothetical protein GY937_25500 [bacterium]|nr:hypothetical protein [bacterium]